MKPDGALNLGESCPGDAVATLMPGRTPCKRRAGGDRDAEEGLILQALHCRDHEEFREAVETLTANDEREYITVGKRCPSILRKETELCCVGLYRLARVTKKGTRSRAGRDMRSLW